MENNRSSSKKKLTSIQEEKLLRTVNYDNFEKKPHSFKKPKRLGVETSPKNQTARQLSKRVLVSVKPQIIPTIKTLFIAKQSRYLNKKGSDNSESALGIDDHSSSTTHKDNSKDESIINSTTGNNPRTKDKVENKESYTAVSQCSQGKIPLQVVYLRRRSSGKYYACPQLIKNILIIKTKSEKTNSKPNKIDISTLTDEIKLPCQKAIHKLNKRINLIERLILGQEIVFRSMGSSTHNLTLSSSDEGTKVNMNSSSVTIWPGCSYVEEYSQVPETSAFQRKAQQTTHLSPRPSKVRTLNKEHNSEQYGRDFTTYDGITARERRHCASVPCKRDDASKMAADRVHKIRRKLNPVHDYRLMDTVHYLAQGEFAPRDDGIKLTPSREAVLSDIIWEDVCRSHWPNARLGRRATRVERHGIRCELQRLIDDLLKERVAHVERRRRRHYKIVKLNHHNETYRPFGKVGDIIVASHKNREGTEGKDFTIRDNAASEIMSDRRWEDRNSRRCHRSQHRFMCLSDMRHHIHRADECIAGPSRNATNCCHTPKIDSDANNYVNAQGTQYNSDENITSGSSLFTCTCRAKAPRLVVKKEKSHRKYYSKDGSDHEHFIVLPTLVVRTPSNVKRQKKFSKLYHRIRNLKS